MTAPVLGPEGHTDPRVKALVRRQVIKVKQVEIGTVVGALVLIGGFALWIIGRSEAASTSAREYSKEAATETKAAVGTLEKRFDQAEDRHAKAHHELQLDNRAIYNTILSGRKQKRMESPVPPVPP